MTKSELIELLMTRSSLPKQRAEEVVNCIFDSMAESLARGEGIEVRGFGSFTLREYEGYEGRNPKSGKKVEVKPKTLPFFRVSKELAASINANRHLPIREQEGLNDPDETDDDDQDDHELNDNDNDSDNENEPMVQESKTK